jgi:hypothetical protein
MENISSVELGKILPYYLPVSEKRKMYGDGGNIPVHQWVESVHEDSLKGQYVDLNTVKKGRYRGSFAAGYQYVVTIPNHGFYKERSLPHLGGRAFHNWILEPKYIIGFCHTESWI